MDIIKNTFALLFIAYSTNAAAEMKYNQLTLTLFNNTNHTFTLNNISGANAGNTFDMQPNFIPPYQSATLTGVTTQGHDLFGLIDFQDDSGNDSTLLILDPRRIHIKQPMFTFSYSDPLYSSSITNMQYYIDGEPQDLMVKSATVTLDQNTNPLKS